MVSRFILLLLIIHMTVGCNSTVSNDSTNQHNRVTSKAYSPIESDQLSDVAKEQDNYSPINNYSQTPIAIINNNKSVKWTDLSQDLAELSGQTIFEEYVLDLQLNNLCQQRKIAITDQMRQHEISNLLESLDPNPDKAARLWSEIRLLRGYGPVRYAKLIERNAKLRALIQDNNLQIDDATISTMFEQIYGARYIIRIITFDTYERAEKILARVRNNEPFYELAARFSTDISADRGGLLDPISPADPVYPMTIRQILADLAPEETSPILVIDTGFAIIQLVKKLPEQNVKLSDVHANLEKLAIRQQESIMMSNLARQLLQEADIIIMDRSLDWSWSQKKTSK